MRFRLATAIGVGVLVAAFVVPAGTALIAIFTTEGSAPFTFCANRQGDVIDKWNAAPGSLILMRGTGLNGAENRPFHAVAGPTTGSRVSLTFRMSDG